MYPTIYSNRKAIGTRRSTRSGVAEARDRVAFTPLMNSTSQTAVGPLSLEAGTDCDFSFYRAARSVIGLKRKEITAF